MALRGRRGILPPDGLGGPSYKLLTCRKSLTASPFRLLNVVHNLLHLSKIRLASQPWKCGEAL